MLVLLPLWSSYLARIYAWRLILSKRRRAQLVARPGSGCPTRTSRYTNCGDVDRLLVRLAAVHDPAGLRRARADPGLATSRPRATSARSELDDLPARSSCRSRCPGVVAGSIFTFSLTLGDYITPILVGGADSQFIGNVVYRQRRGRPTTCRSPPRSRRCRSSSWPSTCWSRAGSARSRRSDGDARRAASRSALWTLLVVAFLWLPLVIDPASTRSTRSNIQSWPIPGFTLHWFRVAWHDAGGAHALLALGQGGAPRDGDRARARDDGRRSRSRASASSGARRSRSCCSCRSRCPGSSPAWRSNSFYTFAGDRLLALDDRDRARDVLRRRRLQQRARAAAAHVAVARSRRRWTSAPTAGRRSASSRCRCSRRRSSPAALLAFALSFDEVIVTIFTAGAQNDAADLDPRQHPPRPAAPDVNVVVFVVIVLTVIPVSIAQRLTQDVRASLRRRR